MKKAKETTGADPSAAPTGVDEEEEIGDWPFPMGVVDPFEPRSARAAPRAAQQIQAKQRVDELVRKRLAATTAAEEARLGSRSQRGRWKLSASKARKAFVYAEIIGPPKSLQDD
jgi:hypothetical protein